MSHQIHRRTFLKTSLAAAAAGDALARTAEASVPSAEDAAGARPLMPCGKIADLEISRMLLGGNLLTHFTHSRDLRYVYNLTAQYNTEEKILETLALSEKHGVNTLVIHTVPFAQKILMKHRHERKGKMQWIICPTAEIAPDMKAYSDHVRQLVDEGVDAIYLWGVRSDQLVAEGKVDLIAKAVDIAKDLGVPSGVGAHDLRVIVECEKRKVDADFYIKTFHHHNYPTAPRADELAGVYAEIPGYWCRNPQEVIDVMKDVEKPWIAFKVMAAGAIPPQNAFRYVFESGADHFIAGMFDFEIAEDARIAREALAGVKRTRPWRS
ncbi:MAG: twin-arginine translocation signal domain-containing protein [Planctomycetes bacterium]|nr:twin-arginine translocation signal domain-containing protein [Planctomycetota bacterium]